MESGKSSIRPLNPVLKNVLTAINQDLVHARMSRAGGWTNRNTNNRSRQ